MNIINWKYRFGSIKINSTCTITKFKWRANTQNTVQLNLACCVALCHSKDRRTECLNHSIQCSLLRVLLRNAIFRRDNRERVCEWLKENQRLWKKVTVFTQTEWMNNDVSRHYWNEIIEPSLGSLELSAQFHSHQSWMRHRFYLHRFFRSIFNGYGIIWRARDKNELKPTETNQELISRWSTQFHFPFIIVATWNALAADKLINSSR